jgi:hypothetical protein
MTRNSPFATLASLRRAFQQGYCCTSVLYGSPQDGLSACDLVSDLGGRYWDRTSDLLGVNEPPGGRCRSLMQVSGRSRSLKVDVVRCSCCTLVLHLGSWLTLTGQSPEPRSDGLPMSWMPISVAVRFTVNKILTVITSTER